MKRMFVIALVFIAILCATSITAVSIGISNTCRLNGALSEEKTVLYGDPIGGGGPPGAPPIGGNGTGN